MKKWAFVILAAGGLAVTAQPGQAQDVRFGPQLAWADDFDLGVGGRVDFGLGDLFGVEEGPFSNLFGIATATYYFWDCGSDDIDCSFMEFEGNLAVPFVVDASIEPYAGAGLHVGRISFDEDFDNPFFDVGGSSTEVGLNLLGGIFFPISDLDAFAQGKFELGGAEQLVLSTGILF